MVYISHPTENGALYTLSELEALHQVCRKHGLYLFLDGARLGYGLTARGADVSIADLARLCDVFYIGGTKCGALFGEAVVLVNPELQRDFRYSIKQNGGMLAKGRLLGLQFLTLFEDDLYYDICRAANEQAYRIAAACREAGFSFFAESPTNQQFPIFPNRCCPGSGRSTPSPFGPRWMRLTPPSACVPAGPPGRRPWISSSPICASWAKSCNPHREKSPRSRRFEDFFSWLLSRSHRQPRQRLPQQHPRQAEKDAGQRIGHAQQVFSP